MGAAEHIRTAVVKVPMFPFPDVSAHTPATSSSNRQLPSR